MENLAPEPFLSDCSYQHTALRCTMDSTGVSGQIERESVYACSHQHIFPYVEVQIGRGFLPNWPDSFTYLTLPLDDVEQADIVALFGEALPFIDKGIEAGRLGQLSH